MIEKIDDIAWICPEEFWSEIPIDLFFPSHFFSTVLFIYFTLGSCFYDCTSTNTYVVVPNKWRTSEQIKQKTPRAPGVMTILFIFSI